KLRNEVAGLNLGQSVMQAALAQHLRGGTAVWERGVAPSVRRDDCAEVRRLIDKIDARVGEHPEKIRRSDLIVKNLVSSSLAGPDKGQTYPSALVKGAQVATDSDGRSDGRHEETAKLHPGGEQTCSNSLA